MNNRFDKLFEQAFEGIAKGKTLKNIADQHQVPTSSIEKELKKGTKVEKEHTKSKSLAKRIAKDHLAEVPNYYSKLKKIEKK